MKLRSTSTAIALAAALLGILALADAATVVGKPFAGFVVGPHGVVGFRDPPAWTGPHHHLLPGDQVLKADGRPVPDNATLQAYVEARPAGTVVAYQLAGGRQVSVPTMPFSWADLWWVFGIGTLGGLAHLALGYMVLRARPNSAAARAHWWYCLGIAGFFLPLPAAFQHPSSLVLEYAATALLIVPILDLATTFPADLPRLRRALRGLGGVASVLTLAALAWGLADPRVMPAVLEYQIVPPILALALLLALWSWQAVNSANAPERRAQARVVGLGMAVAMAPAMGYSMAQLAGAPLPPIDLSVVTLTAFPAAVAYAILRYGLLDVPRLAREVALYASLSTGLALVYLAVAFAAGEVAGPGVGTVAVALALNPLHGRLRRLLDRGRMGHGAGAMGVLATFGARASSGRQDLEGSLAEATQRLLGASWVAVGPHPEAALTIPLEADGHDLGVLAVGPRVAPGPYTDEEQALVQALAAQAALALRHARLAEEQVQLQVREQVASALAAERAALVRQLVHDLATDLSNLALALELAKEDPSAPRPWAAAKRSLHHIEAFLAQKRGQLAGLEPPRRCDAGEVLATLREDLAAAGRIVEGPGPHHPALVGLEAPELRQVLANVLDNAFKATPPGGQVRIATTTAEGALLIEVADDGPGIAPELLPTPGDGRRGPSPHPGSGLGLANAMAVLARAGGGLAWRNAERGAVVSLRLPLAD